MKKLIACVIAIVMVLSLIGGAAGAETTAAPTDEPAAPVFAAGTYEGIADSVGGPLRVSVTVSEDRIEAIEILETHDTDNVRNVPLERIPAMIIENQSVNVDGVSGATLTSFFLKNAINDALSKATDDLSSFQTRVTYAAPGQEDMDVDVVVVGAGLAGMSAGSRIAAAGYKVVVLEKVAYIGGDSLYSGQVATQWDIEPLESNFVPSIEFLASQGVRIAVGPTFAWAGREMATVAATNDDGYGVMASLVNDMRDVIESNGSLVLTDTPAIGLLTEDGKVLGVVAQPRNQDAFNIKARAVVLASGGFSMNADLINKYLPYASGSRGIGAVGDTGDAIEWVKAVDGKLIGMDAAMSSFITVSANTGYHAGAGTNHYIDKNGDLITESTHYNEGAMQAYMEVGNETIYLVNAKEETWGEPEALMLAKTVFFYETLDEVIKTYGLTNIKETMRSLGCSEDGGGGWYVSPARVGIYGTYGGVCVDETGRVLNNSDEIISGLYAAGEVTGNRAYQLTGEYGGGLGHGLVLGYVAGNTVVEDLSK